jgi:pimeloyl-ACP methyl ester carboxylesterase
MTDLKNHSSGFADVNGARIYYEIAGEGHPVALIHAGIADSRMWNHQFAEFAQTYRVLRFDARGYGQSSLPPGEYSWRGDLYELTRQLGIERAYLIGVSMGGGAAIDAALERPDFVAALIAVGPGVSGFNVSDPEDEAVYEQVEAAVKAGDLQRANELEVHLWADGPGRTPEQVNPAVRDLVREMNWITYTHLKEAEQAKTQPLEPPAAGRLGDIHVPALAIIGDQDLFGIKQAVDLIAANVPGARKVVMHDTAHVPNMEKPEEFNRIVLDFLGSLG